MHATKVPKQDELPLPPPPEEQRGATASSILISTGASAISLLGSAVMGIGSAAVHAISAAPAETDTKASSPKDAKTEQPSAPSETTVLGSLSAALLTRAASVRDAAITSVTSSASSLATTAAHAITDAASSTLHNAAFKTSPAQPHTDPPEHPQIRRASTLPIQYTATGEPFSSDPSISAMQRIPDRPCGSHHALAHCCSAPNVLTSLAKEDAECCTCRCYAADTSSRDDCPCAGHAKAAYSKGQSGHFHRVEQLVKGTKRVVRDIKNVL